MIKEGTTGLEWSPEGVATPQLGQLKLNSWRLWSKAKCWPDGRYIVLGFPDGRRRISSVPTVPEPSRRDGGAGETFDPRRVKASSYLYTFYILNTFGSVILFNKYHLILFQHKHCVSHRLFILTLRLNSNNYVTNYARCFKNVQVNGTLHGQSVKKVNVSRIVAWLYYR